MTDKTICPLCPFCQTELVKSESTTVDIWNCPNENCKAHTYFGDKDFWQVLTEGKKAQDMLNKVDLLLGHAKSCERNNIVVGGSTYRAIIQAIDLCRAEIASITKGDKE